MKRAQAAMEFLMTYGWAILVVLVVIGALAYFGVLNPQNLLPERCELQQGFYCKDYRVVAVTGTTDWINFTFQNGRGTGMMLGRVTAQGTGDIVSVVCDTHQWGATDYGADIGTETWAGKAGRHVENGATVQVGVPCIAGNLDGLSGSGKKKFDINITWYNADSSSDFNHTMNGQLLAGIETSG